MTFTGELSPLLVTATAAVGPWGIHAAELLAAANGTSTPRRDVAPPVAGFVGSSFNPIVYRCLKTLAFDAGIPHPAHTAVVLASGLGDAWTLDTTSQCVIRGERVSAALFYQSVPVSIMGYAARELGIQGGLFSVSGLPDPWHEALELCRSLLEAGELRRVILLIAAAPESERVQAIYRQLEPRGGSVEPAEVAFAVSLALGDTADSRSPWLVTSPNSLFVGRDLGGALSQSAQPVETSSSLPVEARTIAGVCLAVQQLRSGSQTGAWRIPIATSGAAVHRCGNSAKIELGTIAQERG